MTPAMAPAADTAPVQAPSPVAVEATHAVEVIEDVKAEAARARPEVVATVQQEAPAAVAIVQTVKTEIAAKPAPAIEQPPAPVATAAEDVAPVTAVVRTEPVQIDLVDAVNEATADTEAAVEAVTPTPAPAAPKPVSTPATGSLFFVADADTPPSITRSLFEPAVTPVKPADDIAQSDKQDDDTTEERSA